MSPLPIDHEATAEPAPPDRDLAAEVVELRRELEERSARLDEVTRAYSRLQQDKDDFRRRAEREKDRVLGIERGNVALSLLEAVDQLELSLQAAPQGQSCRDCLGLGNGLRLIRDGLLRKVEQSGLQRFATVGQPFDPALHEALELVAVEDPTLDGTVIAEVSAGYRQGERVLRPARVTVGKLDAPAAQTSSFGNN